MARTDCKTAELVELSEADTERIIDLERRSFIPPLQATAEMVRERFTLGHFMLGLEQGDVLVGMISAAFAWFDPADRRTFPDTKREFCMLSPAEKFNALLMYNFEVDPECRGKAYPARLLSAALQRGHEAGCQFGVACPRIPSYAGSQEYSQESVVHRPAVKAAIDRHLAGGPYPSPSDLLQDPLLALYHRLGRAWQCKFHWVIHPWTSDADH